MKRFIISVLCTVSVLSSFFMSANAHAAEDVVVSLSIDNPYMTVNGESAEIDAGRGTAPVIMNDRTLVPVRAIIEAFGGEVLWDGATRTTSVGLDGDNVTLVTDSTDAYINGSMHTLDAAPAIINDRTMLPLRFIAEGFGLGIAWDSETKTVYIIRNGFDEEEYNSLTASLLPYSGEPYCEVFENVPQFKEYEIIDASFEYYSKTDELDRCDVCIASISEDIMPTEERGSISSVTPSGWKSIKYDNVSGKYLYNRCHLIGFQLTGENANKKNLITGTRYLNVDAMLPFENMVAEYIEETNNSVMYRATPVFSGENLVADGVLLEAYSIEDNGEGISFCVYCYNVQPGILIDYKTGDSGISEITYTTPEIEEAYISENTNTGTIEILNIYRTPSGKKYHYDAECGGKNSYETTLSEAVFQGLTPCSKCTE